MLDRNYILENIKEVKENCKNRNAEVDLHKFEVYDKQRTEYIVEIDGLRKQRNEVAEKMKKAKESERDSLIEKGKELKIKISDLETKLENIETLYLELYDLIPNKTHPDAPIGTNEDQNKVVYKVGEPKKFNFQPKEHWELGESLGIIDIKTAAKVVGSRFAYLKGDLVLLEFALVQFVLDTVTNKEKLQQIADEKNIDIKVTDFIPVVPPVMIRPEIMQKMARLEPREERYHIPSDDLYLVGSAEHTMGPMHMNHTFESDELPLRYIGFSTAFRREAGSYGKDTKGIFRVHQFDKLEFETYTLPENSENEQDFIIAIQEYLMKSLALPYQLVFKCTGDMGAPDYREFDIETWLPGQQRYRETHTSDLMTDYQSRRLNIKVRKNQKNTEFVHMNDATAFAIGRTLIAIIENYQNEDGTIDIPEVLQKYCGNKTIIK